MSYDLEIATHARCSVDTLRQVLRKKGYTATGELIESERGLLVEKVTRGERRAAFTLDGPMHVELEDLDE